MLRRTPPKAQSSSSVVAPISSTSTSLSPSARLRHLCLVAVGALRYLDGSTFAATVSAMGDLGVGTPSFSFPFPRHDVSLHCSARVVDLTPTQIAMTLRAMAQMSMIDSTVRDHFSKHFLKHHEIPLVAIAEMGRAFYFAKTAPAFQSFLHEIAKQQQQQQQKSMMNNNNNTLVSSMITSPTPEAGISMLRSLALTKTCYDNSSSSSSSNKKKRKNNNSNQHHLPAEIIVAISTSLLALPPHLIGVASTALLSVHPDIRQALLPCAIKRLSDLFQQQIVSASSTSSPSSSPSISFSDYAKSLKLLIDGKASRPVIQLVADKLFSAAAELSADDVCRAFHAISHDSPQMIELQWTEQNLRPLMGRVAKLHSSLQGVHVASCLTAFERLRLLGHPLTKVLIRRLQTVVPELAVEDASNCLSVLNKNMMMTNGNVGTNTSNDPASPTTNNAAGAGGAVAISLQAIGEIANFFGPTLCVDSLGNRVGLHRVLLSGSVTSSTDLNQHQHHQNVINTNSTNNPLNLSFHRVPVSVITLCALEKVFVPLSSLLPEHTTTADMGSLLLVNASDLTIEQLISTSLAALKVTSLIGTDFLPIWDFVIKNLSEKIFEELDKKTKKSSLSSVANENSSSKPNNNNNNNNTDEEIIDEDSTTAEKESNLLSSIVMLASDLRFFPVIIDAPDQSSIQLLASAITTFIAPRLVKMKAHLLDSFLSSLVDLQNIFSLESSSSSTDDEKNTEKILQGKQALENDIISTLERSASVCHTMPPKVAFAVGMGLARCSSSTSNNNNNTHQEKEASKIKAAEAIVSFVIEFCSKKLVENPNFLETIATPSFMRSRNIKLSPEEFSRDFLAGFSDAGELLLQASMLLKTFAPQCKSVMSVVSQNFESKFLLLFQKVLESAEPPSLEIVTTIADNISSAVESNTALFLQQTASSSTNSAGGAADESPLAVSFFKPLSSFLIKRSDEASLNVLFALSRVCMSLDANNNNQSNTTTVSNTGSANFPHHSTMLIRCINVLFLRHLKGSINNNNDSGMMFTKEENALIEFAQFVVSSCGSSAKEKFPQAIAVLETVGKPYQPAQQQEAPKPPPTTQLFQNHQQQYNQQQQQASSPTTASTPTTTTATSAPYNYDSFPPSKKPQKIVVPKNDHNVDHHQNNNNNNNNSSSNNTNNAFAFGMTQQQQQQQPQQTATTFTDQQVQYLNHNNQNGQQQPKMAPHHEHAQNLQMQSSYESLQGKSAFYQSAPAPAAAANSQKPAPLQQQHNNERAPLENLFGGSSQTTSNQQQQAHQQQEGMMNNMNVTNNINTNNTAANTNTNNASSTINSNEMFQRFQPNQEHPFQVSQKRPEFDPTNMMNRNDYNNNNCTPLHNNPHQCVQQQQQQTSFHQDSAAASSFQKRSSQLFDNVVQESLQEAFASSSPSSASSPGSPDIKRVMNENKNENAVNAPPLPPQQQQHGTPNRHQTFVPEAKTPEKHHQQRQPEQFLHQQNTPTFGNSGSGSDFPFQQFSNQQPQQAQQSVPPPPFQQQQTMNNNNQQHQPRVQQEQELSASQMNAHNMNGNNNNISQHHHHHQSAPSPQYIQNHQQQHQQQQHTNFTQQQQPMMNMNQQQQFQQQQQQQQQQDSNPGSQQQQYQQNQQQQQQQSPHQSPAVATDASPQQEQQQQQQQTQRPPFRRGPRPLRQVVGGLGASFDDGESLVLL